MLWAQLIGAVAGCDRSKSRRSSAVSGCIDVSLRVVAKAPRVVAGFQHRPHIRAIRIGVATGQTRDHGDADRAAARQHLIEHLRTGATARAVVQVGSDAVMHGHRPICRLRLGDLAQQTRVDRGRESCPA